MSINQILEELARTPSRNDKIAILTDHQNNPTLVHVVRLAISPVLNFYIKKIPEYARRADGHTNTLEWAIQQLDKLSTRTVTGNDAIKLLQHTLESVSCEDAEVIKKIIQRDLRCGVSESTVNKVWKGLIPEYPYMRCTTANHARLDKFDWDAGIFSQQKADGMFVNTNIHSDGTVELFSRSGSMFPMDAFKELADNISKTFTHGTQTHGEILVRRDNEVLPREIGNGVLNSVLKGGSFAPDEQPTLLVWDQIPLCEAVPSNKYPVKYRDRFESLSRQVQHHNTSPLISLIETRTVHNMDEAMMHYAEMLAGGYEGTIIKDPNAIWEDTTSKHQVKLKLEINLDLKIVGFTHGTGKNTDTFGAITCESSCGALRVDVSGFKDKPQKGVMSRSQISDIRDKLINTVITVKANNLMPPTKSNPKWSLFLPRWVEFRHDKHTADDIQSIRDQFESAIQIDASDKSQQK